MGKAGWGVEGILIFSVVKIFRARVACAGHLNSVQEMNGIIKSCNTSCDSSSVLEDDGSLIFRGAGTHGEGTTRRIT